VTDPSARPSSPPAGRRIARLATAPAIATVLCLGLLPGASADDPAVPTREAVRSARQHVETTAQAVGRIKAELIAAEEAVLLLEVEAQKAVEAYNGAVYELEQSRIAERRASRAAEEAAAHVTQLQALISDAVVRDSIDGGAMADFGVLVTDPDPDALMDQLASFDSFAGAMDSRLDQIDAQRIVADVLAEQAADAVERREAATERMDTARDAAQQALDVAADAAASLEARKDALIVELAQAQHISVELARSRQEALVAQAEEEARLLAEQQAQERAEREALREQRQQEARARARADATADARQQARQDARDDALAQGRLEALRADRREDRRAARREARLEARLEARREAREERRQERREERRDEREEDAPSEPTYDPAPSSGVEGAVAFALAQVGEPYVWAAAGPDAWDCSGLTMGAWGAAGRSLPHYSVAQYEATTPVSMSSLRRGDLLFWSEGSPGSIYHVALYLGDGMMVHAPRTGRNVEVVSMYYWIAPDLAGRV
jgi:cell wall-associated NlpC family hydrolase